jgi:cell division septal protein FtsQ
MATVVGMVGGMAVGLLVIWQVYEWALQRFVYENETYTIRRVELRHGGRLKPEAIRRWADVHPGQNLLALDLDRVRQDLEMNPWVERADVEALRPDCLRLRVWEREPVARVVTWRVQPGTGRAWSETNLVDAEGMVLPSLLPEWVATAEAADFSRLPQLTGLDPAEVIPGQRVGQARVPAALSLLRALRAAPVVVVAEVERLEVRAPMGLEATLRDGSQVVFGLTDFERQLARWQRIGEYAVAQGGTFQWLDLSVTNNVPGRWRVPIDPSPSPATRKG